MVVDCIGLGSSRGTLRARRKEEAVNVILELRPKNVFVKGSKGNPVGMGLERVSMLLLRERNDGDYSRTV